MPLFKVTLYLLSWVRKIVNKFIVNSYKHTSYSDIA